MGYISLSCKCVSMLIKGNLKKKTDDDHKPDAPRLQVLLHYRPYRGSKERAVARALVVVKAQVVGTELALDNSHGWGLGTDLEIQGNWADTWEGEQEAYVDLGQQGHGPHMDYR